MYWRFLFVAMLFLLHGCTQPVPKEVSIPPPPPAPPRPAVIPVTVLLSEDTPAYTDVARALSRQLGRRATIRTLSGNPLEDQKLAASSGNDERRQLVSIGLAAAVATRPLSGRQVVFCQVFNYRDYELLSEQHKGISLIPAPGRIFAAWHSLSPHLTDVGVVTGPGLDDLLQVARASARSQGITLHHVVVNSDKEYLYAYKQLAGKVQGYWLLPDNRVLSGLVLRDVMTFSVRNSKQVEVFSDELLKLGGLLSATADAQEVAQLVAERLEEGQNRDLLPGPEIVYPDRPNLRINAVMAQHLNLSVPTWLKKYANSP